MTNEEKTAKCICPAVDVGSFPRKGSSIARDCPIHNPPSPLEMLLDACEEAMTDANRQCRADAPGVSPDWAGPMRDAMKRFGR